MIETVLDAGALLCTDRVTVHPVTELEVAHRYARDPDLQAVAALLARTHHLVVTTVMPLPTMIGLLDAIDPLDQWVRRRTPHVIARPT